MRDVLRLHLKYWGTPSSPELADAIEEGTLQQLVFHLHCFLLKNPMPKDIEAALLTPEVARAARTLCVPEHQSDALWLVTLLLTSEANGV